MPFEHPYERAANEIATDLAKTYRIVADRLLNDLRDRIGGRAGGYAFIRGGSVEAPEGVLSDINAALKGMRRDLRTVAPHVAEYIAAEMRPLVSKEMDKFLTRVHAAMPDEFQRRFADLGKYYKPYITEGSLLDRKILEIMQFRPGPPPIHHRLLDTTRAHLQAAIESGKGYDALVLDIQRDVFGVDWRKGETHPALPRSDGTVADPTYGVRRGYARPTNPNGVLGDVQRLVRTELREADTIEKTGMIEELANDPDLEIDGYAIDIIDDACEQCEAAFGKGWVEFGEPLPPIHPNDRCEVIGPHFRDS